MIHTGKPEGRAVKVMVVPARPAIELTRMNTADTPDVRRVRAHPVNNSTGEGKFLIDRVIPKNNPPDVSCYSGVCQGEAVWQDANAFNATQNEMIAQCVPNHQ